MEIELKHQVVEYSELNSAELFTATLYIDGKRAGIAFNDENSSNPRYIAFNNQSLELIKNAEQFCLKLPPATIGELKVDMNLTLILSLMMWDHYQALELEFAANHIKKLQSDHIVIGFDERSSETSLPISFRLPEAIETGNDQRRQYYWLHAILEDKMPLLVDGKKILNNNLYGEILVLAGLSPDQYVQPKEYKPQEIEQSISRGR